MKKVSELEGAELDYWVAKAAGAKIITGKLSQELMYIFDDEEKEKIYGGFLEEKWNPSSNWSQGGPIIEREGIQIGLNFQIHLLPDNEKWRKWFAMCDGGPLIGVCSAEGSTPLIAAMRAFVASKYGEEVDEQNHQGR